MLKLASVLAVATILGGCAEAGLTFGRTPSELATADFARAEAGYGVYKLQRSDFVYDDEYRRYVMILDDFLQRRNNQNAGGGPED
jgi:hypothetical protein